MKTAAAKTIGDRVKERRRALGLSQPQLAKMVGGITYQAIQALEAGGGSRHLVPIARALGVTAEWLQDGAGPAPSKPVAARPGAMEKLKVLGMAECGADGWSLWNGDVIDLIDRPASLAGVPNAYAVYVVGASMEPRYHPGEVVHIHPGRPIDVGAYVLVQKKPKASGDTPLAVIKRLARRSGAKITLEQFNPPKLFDIKAGDIVSIHRVVGSGEA
ncbi:MAG TPA: helix-turn-helix domain-containing protein [Rhizomicrobium sp.]|jgi:phage repressor protein C with HTH and peptisase S24 domain|nr:helix-turn-helix domain-containing protein [Rhizomicrobium sp.]